MSRRGLCLALAIVVPTFLAACAEAQASAASAAAPPQGVSAEPTAPAERRSSPAQGTTPDRNASPRRDPAGAPRPDDLLDVRAFIPDLVLDLRYATADNFLGEAVYPPDARCFLRRAVAERLARVADRLRAEDGTRLRVFDCYRPLSVQRKMWAIFPRPGYVASPKVGSVHNRGAAVDLTLAAPDGTALPMPTDFDTFDERAWHAYGGGSEAQRRNRDRLRAAMRAEGFRTIRKEWWHYEAPDRNAYPVLDRSFEELQAEAR